MYDYNFFFSHLKNSYTRKKKKTEIILTKKYINISLFLYKEGLINNFFVDHQRNILVIFFKYSNNRCLLDSIQLNKYKKHSVLSNFKTKELNKQFRYGNIVCLETQRGLLTLSECFLYNIGGKIIFKIM